MFGYEDLMEFISTFKFAEHYVDPGVRDNLFSLIQKEGEINKMVDVLQAVYNHGRVEAVLDESVLTDLETYQALLHLIRNGYVRESR